MLAVKLHKSPNPSLGKGSNLIPIADWRAGKVQIRKDLLHLGKQYQYITLVNIPDEWPVNFLIRYGDSNFIKAVHCFPEFRPLKDWPAEIKQAIREWWNARKSPWSDTGVEPGGLMCDEPLVLGRRLPLSCIKWTKNLRLLYHGDERRKKRQKEKG
jgi:hypothetical protein